MRRILTFVPVFVVTIHRCLIAAPTIEQAFVAVDGVEPSIVSFYARRPEGSTFPSDIATRWYYSWAAATARAKAAAAAALERKRAEQVRSFQNTKSWIRYALLACPT